MEAFLVTHAAQLDAVKFPQALRANLYEKLTKEIYDIGEKVQIMIDKQSEKMMVSATHDIEPEEDVWLIDHAWTFRYHEAYQYLKENDKLRYRMKNIMSFPDKIDLDTPFNQSDSNPIPEEYKEDKLNLLEYLEKMPDGPTIYNLDEYGIVSLENIPFKEDATEISLFGNRISDPLTVTENLLKFPNLKALWLNDNPIEDHCHNFDEIGEFLPNLEIINSKFTSRANEWAMMFC